MIKKMFEALLYDLTYRSLKFSKDLSSAQIKSSWFYCGKKLEYLEKIHKLATHYLSEIKFWIHCWEAGALTYVPAEELNTLFFQKAAGLVSELLEQQVLLLEDASQKERYLKIKHVYCKMLKEHWKQTVHKNGDEKKMQIQHHLQIE